MALARFKDLCIDAVAAAPSEQFWAAVLGLQISTREDYSWLSGPTAQHAVWVNDVPEPKTVKNRVHVDVHAGAIADLEALGARVLEPSGPDRHWTVLTDPDGQEFCAFLRDPVPVYRLYEIVVDAADPEPIARWWADVYGARLGQDDGAEWWWVDQIPGCPFDAFSFVPVPEPKTVKNRVHWDVSVDTLQPLLDAGATLLRAKGGDITWHVLADPDGNEFCAFDG
jgi:hypothetical protein